MVSTVRHFTLFKKWLIFIIILTACVWEGAPCSTLPTVGENAVTESAWSVLGCMGFALCLAATQA